MTARIHKENRRPTRDCYLVLRSDFTFGPPRSSWAETHTKAVANTTTLMIDFMFCVFVLLETSYENYETIDQHGWHGRRSDEEPEGRKK